MRSIVHVTTVHRLFDVRIFQKQCRGLADRGWDVTLVAHAPEGGNVGVVEAAGVRFHSLGPPAKTRLGRILFRGVRAALSGLSCRPDVLHFHDPELLPFARILKGMGNVVVFDMHEHFPAALETKEWLPAWSRKPLAKSSALGERVLLRGVPVVFAEKNYRQHYPWLERGVEVLNYVDLRRLPKPKMREGKALRLVYVGRISKDRGSISMVNALRLLDASAELHLVGPVDSEHREEFFRALRSDPSVEERAILHGFVPAPKSWEIASGSDVGFALLRATPNYREIQPTKLFEYMALGIPVIASNFPSFRAVVEEFECGICVDPDDRDEIAAAVERLAGDPELARRLGENGRRAAEQEFSWESQLDRLEAFYRELLGEIPRRDGSAAAPMGESQSA